jgi:hypothetical protein
VAKVVSMPKPGTALLIETATGSKYVLTRRPDNSWWVSGENQVSDTSRSLGDRAWPIQPPMLPREGESWVFFSLFQFEPDHPDRIPGGGKITSPVVRVTPNPPYLL